MFNSLPTFPAPTAAQVASYNRVGVAAIMAYRNAARVLCRDGSTAIPTFKCAAATVRVAADHGLALPVVLSESIAADGTVERNFILISR